MKRIIVSLALVLFSSVFITSSAMAGPATNALISCMTDNTTGKDRKDMARWIFVGMSVHPEIKSLSNVTKSDRDQMDRTIAVMVTRLLTENCQKEAKLALEKEADQSPIKASFEIIGRLAMQELLTDSGVQSVFTNFAKYIDMKKFNASIAK